MIYYEGIGYREYIWSLEKLKKWTKIHHKHLTVIFSAKDEKHKQATVLKEILGHQ